MHTRTLKPNAGLGRQIWRTILPLFALFVGLGSSQAVKAQTVSSTYYNDGIVLTSQASGSTTVDANHNYAGLATESPYTGYDKLGKGTPSPNLGTFDAMGTSQLVLNGGSIELDPPASNKTASYTIAAARVQYRVYLQNATAPAYSSVTLPRNGTLNGSQFYSTNSANVNLLAGLTAGGNYILEVVFQTDYQGSNGTTGTDQDPVTSSYQASFTLKGTTPPAFVSGSPSTILISANGGSDVSYTTTAFNGQNLGVFNVNTGRLLLDGGTSTTTENGNNNITDVSLYYRTHSTTTAGGGFSFISLAQTDIVTNPDGTRTRSFSSTAAAQNLLQNISTNNSYNVDVYLVASYNNGSNNFTVRDDNNGNYYVATFSVTGTPIVTTVWTGGFNDNWFDARNWDTGVPDANTNARIPDFQSGVKVNYPNIYSGVVKPATPATTVTNPDGTVDNIPASPGYDNTNSGNAQVRDLTMNGSNQLQRSILRLIQGRLDVFGDFNNPQGSFIQRATAIISFKSSGNQTISGSINGFTNVEIDGGANSIKTLTNSFAVKSGGYLKFINGILATDISLVSSNFVSFDAATTEASTGIVTPAAQLLGETETSYLRGFLTTTQTAPPGTTQSFGNTGLTLSFTGNDPGTITVTRNTGGNYSPSAFGGSNPKPGIRRVFGVQPTNPATNNGGLNAVLTFSYLNNELVNLRVNDTNPPDFSGSDDASKLSLYVSTTGGSSFSQLGRDGIANNTLRKSGVTTFATFTLSEQQTPLPVKLISFDAKRTGANALVTWATASEISNSGFEVQVSTDGTTFRKLAFVASQAINSTTTLKYSFLDEENGKTGTRYYRLSQLDEDGKNEYSPVRVVSFSTSSVASQATTLTAYPNPFTQGDLPSIIVQSASAGNARLQLVDMMGREVSHQDFTTAVGIQEVSIPQAANLSTGIYTAKVTLATGEVKTIRIQKR